MPAYFERLRSGLRQAEELLQNLLPEASYAWGPMDNQGYFPLWLNQGRSRAVLHRFSKEALVALGGEPPDARILELFRQSIVPFVPRS